jgi:phage tail-like protein
MAIFSVHKNFHKKFTFTIEVSGIEEATFQTCSEIAVEVAKIEHFEGGVLIPDKMPGRVTWPDITLTRGATSSLALWQWMREVTTCAPATGGTGAESETPDAFKRTFDIVQRDRRRTEIQRWTVWGVWPVRWSSGDWDNNTDEVRIESVTFAYDYAENRLDVAN